jgi:hypothetical protein
MSRRYHPAALASKLGGLVHSRRLRPAFAACLALVVAGYTLKTARADAPLSPEEQKLVADRLGPTVTAAHNLTLEEGGTIFVVHKEEIASNRIRRGPFDYEAVVKKAHAPSGIVIHKRVDQVKIAPKGPKTELSFRYAIHSEPGFKKGGPIELTIVLTERVGLLNEVENLKLKHSITVKKPRVTPAQLLTDLRGYRAYKELAKARAGELTSVGLSINLAKEDLPSLGSADAALTEKVFELDRWRRRMGVARRHLEHAASSKDRTIGPLGKKYLALLDAPDDQVASLPGFGAAAEVKDEGEAEVEILTPTAEPEPEKPKKEGKEGVATLVPLDQKEKEKEKRPQERDAPRVEEPKAPVAVNEAAPPREPGFGSIDEDLDRSKRDTVIPAYPRGLVLDDPNLAHGAWVRFSFASVSVQRTAIAPAWFFGFETAVTNALGAELTIPTAYISVDLERATPIFTLGNPLIAAKYRFHLSEIEGRRPVLTVRARWGIPISPLNTIPRTQLGAEEFSLPAHFADTYAFMLEKHDLGLGVSAAYRAQMLHVAAQLYFDYFAPVSGSSDTTRFLSLGYGLSAGVRPFEEDNIGFYLEARGASLFAGPRRNELFTYLGARGRFAQYFEPALWISLPFGSVGRVSSLQIGAELRVSYDVEDVISRGRPAKERDQFLE